MSNQLENPVAPLTTDGAPPDAPQLIVPAYFHPAVRRRDWESLVEHGPHIRLVVANPASGPGDRVDESYLAPLRRLRDAGVQVAGYIDTDYGQRPAEDALRDFERYAEWYEVAGAFFDRVSNNVHDVGYYDRLTRDIRSAGAEVVAYNHGTHPVEAYAEIADLLGTFEGTWESYIDATVPRWARARSAGQFFHLVYDVPQESFGDAFLLATLRRAGVIFVTDSGGANPWGRLPSCEFDPVLY